jgi:hypothetical protein
MSNIIDSLKRLERVGSENSKTTRKLIAAAREVSSLIARQFCPGEKESIKVVDASFDRAQGWVRNRNLSGVQPGRRFVWYWVKCDGEGGAVLLREDPYSSKPAESLDQRETALQFAADIADGILDLFSQRLEELNRESTEGLMTLETTLEKLGGAH